MPEFGRSILSIPTPLRQLSIAGNSSGWDDRADKPQVAQIDQTENPPYFQRKGVDSPRSQPHNNHSFGSGERTCAERPVPR
ncbi:MAG TPA: hypothetical protein IGS17_21610 [Oscillatoriales cyanobacterium M59_W2019_021]|nr:hypothetical protein [Oscillatoriales cyanobacterium M4454_W2019_049]HIK53488.1 hypothetical protein [Oscillatoriales cyanobacterium M59_W2019_021]